MGAGYDGTIRIDTRVDEKGFNRGVQGLISSLGKLASAVGVAFGLAAVFSFGKGAVQAATEVNNAMIGLKSVMDGQGRSFTKAKAFIDDYISDGLVPLTDAVTSYKNLAMRGYSDEQIQQTLGNLKDAASFGRQGSLTMGEAVRSATEGLKNENSILVDNAGVTKNVSMMWKDYAEKIGTTVGMLTKQQKIQAEVEGIMAETAFQTGDAAKLAGTYAGQISALGVSWYNLKAAIGNAIIPVLQAIIPYIKAAVDWLVVLINQFAVFMSLLFGVNISFGTTAAAAQTTAQATQEAAAGAADLAANTQDASDAAKGALAAFDELNVLQQETPATGGGGGAQPAPAIPGMPTITEGESAIDESLDRMKAKVAAFKEALMNLLGPAIEALGRLRTELERLGENVWAGLKWAWDNILVPLGTWVMHDALPVFINLLTAALGLLNATIEALKPAALWLWNNLLAPIASWTGGAILTVLNALIVILNALSGWVGTNQELFSNFVLTIVIITAAFWLFNAAVAFLALPLAGVYLAILAVIVVVVLLITYWDVVKQAAIDAWTWIQNTWIIASAWFVTNVTEPIKKAFGTALDWIKNKWETILNGVKTFAKSVVNGIIGIINNMLGAITTGLNKVIEMMNKIKINIPGFLGFPGIVFEIDIPYIQGYKIPYLASGAVIPPNAQFLAMLGDQRSGRNIEAPEALIRQIVREETQGAGGDVTIRMPVYLDSEKIFEGQQRVSRQRGQSLIFGGAGA